MGIRYYAYAFDPDHTSRALADPRSVIGAYPLADAWGFEPGAAFVVTDFQQSLPERDLLYLDKAWSYLQLLTGPRSWGDVARPAYRMFEGSVTDTDCGGWLPWVRALPPCEVAVVARDLESITELDVDAALGQLWELPYADDSSRAYVMHYLGAARDFASTAAADGRGFAYLIG